MVSGRKSFPEAKEADKATCQQPVPESAAQADISMPGNAFRHTHIPSWCSPYWQNWIECYKKLLQKQPAANASGSKNREEHACYGIQNPCPRRVRAPQLCPQALPRDPKSATWVLHALAPSSITRHKNLWENPRSPNKHTLPMQGTVALLLLQTTDPRHRDLNFTEKSPAALRRSAVTRMALSQNASQLGVPTPSQKCTRSSAEVTSLPWLLMHGRRWYKAT